MFQIRLHQVDISAFSGQNKVTKMCPKYLLTRYYKWSSQYQILINRSSELKHYIQNNQVYTVYANTDMASTQIVCPIYMVNLGDAQSDGVA